MKQILLSFSSLMLILSASCQSDVTITDDLSTALTMEEQQLDPSCFYPSRTSGSFSEKIDQLQLDDQTLKNLSTKELTEVCMAYPLALSCFAYDDVEIAVEMIANSFNGFQELKQRTDGFGELLNFYDRKLCEIESLATIAPNYIKPLKLAFYERFIASGFIGSKNLLRDSEKLHKLINKAQILKSSITELQGHISSESITALQKAAGLMISRTSPISQLTTVKTVNGWDVDAFYQPCQDATQETEEGLEFINTQFPEVEIVGNASCSYNCHSYTWYVSEGGDKYWINRRNRNFGENVSRFWTDGSYTETSKNNAKKIFYPNGDHSANVISGDICISKWGSYHLVRHRYWECPYDTTGIKYFTYNYPPFKTGYVIWDKIPTITPLNGYEDFAIESNYDPTYYRTDIFVSSPKDPTEAIDSSNYSIISRTNTSAKIQFKSAGPQYVCFYIYRKSTGKLIATYTSDEVYVER